MRHLVVRLWREQEGVLTFEWILLLTLLVVGVVAGLSATRDSLLDELGDVTQAMLALDQSFTIDDPLVVTVHNVAISGGSDSGFQDNAAYDDCGRSTFQDDG